MPISLFLGYIISVRKMDSHGTLGSQEEHGETANNLPNEVVKMDGRK